MTRTTSTLLAATAVTTSILGAGLLHPQSVHAATASLLPVEISPVCVDAASHQAVWTASNKNLQSVTINWTNLDDQVSGSFTAAPTDAEHASLMTTFKTDYKEGANNTTNFVMPETNDNVTRNASSTACDDIMPQPTAPTCVTADQVTSADIQATFLDRYHAAVKYVGQLPLCDGEQVQVNFSGYVIANDNYDPTVNKYLDGNVNATPQYLYTNDTVYLSSHNTEMNLAIDQYDDEDCYNIQTDVYRGSVVEQIAYGDTTGHGTNNIKSEVYPATAICDEGGNGGDNGGQTGGNTGGSTPTNGPTNGGNTTQPGMGAGAPVTPAATPVAATQPAQLADTGASTILPTILASLLALTALVMSLPVLRSVRR